MAAPHPLYGGAMSMVIPEGMADASAFREVPDHQEVFADAEKDQSIIVEILEAIEHKAEKALQYHFDEIAQTNESEHSTVYKIEEIQLETIGEVYVLVGQQEVAKFNEKAKALDAVNSVCMFMALVRVPQHSADVLVSLNVPLKIGHSSSSFAATSGGPLPVDIEKSYSDFKLMLGTFRINDYSLFA
ncbi:hypothetical protein GGI25_006396 [Coemansia spiralis]|uniref:Ran guanine nucleotide release factor n=2 Tax=Coemansia TaxID=4863 RepID=A0A9W8FWZ0_9FUNG|nr:Ran GTPase binding protein [Coemansia spiralis]KAJ1986171.1 hypothetical protein EDC05_006391 [Coemansia umbellata]KAJ2618645.1 hypothetical protein GGI26_006445 [Coemansia sp. RSA 1358]KAJ2668648.1 hypothetical protein GGI25_006396 [Coemansia spiralis]